MKANTKDYDLYGSTNYLKRVARISACFFLTVACLKTWQATLLCFMQSFGELSKSIVLTLKWFAWIPHKRPCGVSRFLFNELTESAL